jgi:chromosomal replication initiator protein
MTSIAKKPSRITFRPLRGDRVSNILFEAANEYNVSVNDIRGPSREKQVVAARFCCIVRLRDETNLSYPAIGRILDRDHTTVMYGERRFRERLMNGETECH